MVSGLSSTDKSAAIERFGFAKVLPLTQIITMEFQLNGQEYIQLNDLLKVLSIVGTGGEAKIRILEGEVFLNGELCQVIRKKLFEGDVVQISDLEILIVN